MVIGTRPLAPVWGLESTGQIRETLAAADGIVAYALVFVLSAIPLFEILLVIPPAIGLGLNPVLVGIVAFLGNVLPVYALVGGHGRIERGSGADAVGRRTRPHATGVPGDCSNGTDWPGSHSPPRSRQGSTSRPSSPSCWGRRGARSQAG